MTPIGVISAKSAPENAELPNGPLAREDSGDGTIGTPSRPKITKIANTADARPSKVN
jgi:hypothetical protein